MTPDDLVRAVQRHRYKTELFPWQSAFFNDPAKIKAAVCGRRAGKTWACCAGLYEAAIRLPGSISPYIALTGKSARFILWPILCQFDRRYGLGLKLNHHELVATLPNESQIMCAGADDARKVEFFRGMKIARGVVDESASFPGSILRYLCEDVLEAALMDLDGDLWLVGSPNAACAGHFHDLTTGKNPAVRKIATHHWTVLDNVYIPHASNWLERKRKDKGWTLDNPIYRREYLGQWVRDTSSLVFRFDRDRHMVVEMPVPTRGIAGVDLGASDHNLTTAIVLSGWTRHNRTLTISYAKKYPALNPDDLADEILRLGRTNPIEYTVLDEGGLGRGYGDQWRQRRGMSVVAAEKREKKAYVEHLNGDLDANRVKFLEGATVALIEELELLQWDEDRKEYDKRYADHAADAFLYNWRESYHWNEETAPASEPEVGTREWYVAQAARDFEEDVQQSLEQGRDMWEGVRER